MAERLDPIVHVLSNYDNPFDIHTVVGSFRDYLGYGDRPIYDKMFQLYRYVSYIDKYEYWLVWAM